jgi:putative holliday junction resolvase
MNKETSKPQAKRIVGLDFGLARIGIAISDEQKIIATPMMTLQAEKKTEETILKLLTELRHNEHVRNYQITEIVIGLPLLMSGKKGMLADEVLHFVELLKKQIEIPITLWDERLTSVQAERSLREGSLTRKKRSRIVDTVAATIILQSYLDHKRMQTTG